VAGVFLPKRVIGNPFNTALQHDTDGSTK